MNKYTYNYVYRLTCVPFGTSCAIEDVRKCYKNCNSQPKVGCRYFLGIFFTSELVK